MILQSLPGYYHIYYDEEIIVVGDIEKLNNLYKNDQIGVAWEEAINKQWPGIYAMLKVSTEAVRLAAEKIVTDFGYIGEASATPLVERVVQLIYEAYAEKIDLTEEQLKNFLQG